MAAGKAVVPTSDRKGRREDRIYFSAGTAATLNGATEHAFVLPRDPNDGSSVTWQLTDVILSAGTNTTHSSSAQIDVTVEKNGDGGTSAMTTTPKLTDAAGTGFRSTAAAGTGITQAVPKTDADGKFSSGQIAFCTLTEAGSGGTDPSDVFFVLEFTRLQDFDPVA